MISIPKLGNRSNYLMIGVSKLILALLILLETPEEHCLEELAGTVRNLSCRPQIKAKIYNFTLAEFIAMLKYGSMGFIWGKSPMVTSLLHWI
ncbi:hypothetical protein D3C73_1359540 [compost metagenome]